MAGLTYESEGRIVSCLQKWLDRYWRRGKISAKAKAALCSGLLAVTRGMPDNEVKDIALNAHRKLEDIRHMRSRTCTDMFVNCLTGLVLDINASLDRDGADCPRVVIPLRGGDGPKVETEVRVPEEHTGTDRTLVPVRDVTPVEIDTRGLGETVVRIVILDGKVTCDISQRRK